MNLLVRDSSTPFCVTHTHTRVLVTECLQLTFLTACSNFSHLSLIDDISNGGEYEGGIVSVQTELNKEGRLHYAWALTGH